MYSPRMIHLPNTKSALQITAEGSKEEIKKLRTLNIVLEICDELYELKPFAIKTVPWKLETCKFADKCRNKACRFVHSESERYLPIVIKTNEEFVDHLEILIPGLKFKPYRSRWAANAWAPRTPTLEKMVTNYAKALKEYLLLKGTFKTRPCQKSFAHDKESCVFFHEDEVAPSETVTEIETVEEGYESY